MKKTAKLITILMATLLLFSCGEGFVPPDPDYLYVKGTAKYNAATRLYEFVSADIVLNNWDRITSKLEPVDPKALDGKGEYVDNVLFMYPTSIYSAEYKSTCNEGYEFEEWKVRKLEDVIDLNTVDEWEYEYRKAAEGIANAEKFLNAHSHYGSKEAPLNRFTETPDDIKYDILPYIYPEYNRAPVYLALVEEKDLTLGTEWEGKGTPKEPYSLDEFRSNFKNAQEINVFVTMTDKDKDKDIENKLSVFLNSLVSETDFPSLEEVHIELTTPKATTADLVILNDKLDYVVLKNMKFNTINLTDSKTRWKFRNCEFNELNINTRNTVILDDCKYDRISALKDGNIIIR